MLQAAGYEFLLKPEAKFQSVIKVEFNRS